MTESEKQQIAQMRKNGVSYSMIASSLSLPIGTVKAFCSRNPLEKIAALPVQPAVSEEPAIMCEQCGSALKNTPGHRQKKFCSATCRQRYWRSHIDCKKQSSVVRYTCAQCGKAFSDHRGHQRKYCSHICYIAARYRKDDVNAAE